MMSSAKESSTIQLWAKLLVSLFNVILAQGHTFLPAAAHAA